jgi:hypothetical protein
MKGYFKIIGFIMLSSCLLLEIDSTQAQIKEGTLVINQDPRIDSLVNLSEAYSKSFPYISGYRVQIFMASGNDALDNAEKVKEDFDLNFPGLTAYITFREPYYRVRVGDYRTRLEANQQLKAIRKSYQDAWIIQDKISLPPLITYQKTDSYE